MEDRVERMKERKKSWGLFGGLSTWRRDDDAEAGFVLIVVIQCLPSSSANDLYLYCRFDIPIEQLLNHLRLHLHLQLFRWMALVHDLKSRSRGHWQKTFDQRFQLAGAGKTLTFTASGGSLGVNC